MLGFGCPDDGKYDTPHPTPYLHGAAMMIKREVVEKAGMMPEISFLYYGTSPAARSSTKKARVPDNSASCVPII